MGKASLRNAAIVCLVIWAAIWLLFLLMRLSPLDIRSIPGAGRVLFIALVIALLAPIAAMGLAGGALALHPRVPRDRLVLGWAVAAFFGQVFLFLITRWL
jgi:hypothetical protein